LADGTTSQWFVSYRLTGKAAMEPVLGGRDDLPGSSCLPPAHRAAMEPVLGGRDDDHRLAVDAGQGQRPQWSPSLADGTTRSRDPGL